MIGFVSSRTDRPLPLEFTVDGKILEVTLPARVLTNTAATSNAAARLGLGLVQAPRFGFKDHLKAGTLVEVLADWPPSPTPISVLYPTNRQLSPRVRVFVDWLIETIGPHFD